MSVSILGKTYDIETTTRLDLSNKNLENYLLEINKICKLIKLQSLNLAENGINSLPVEICKLINLRELNLGFNSLKSLPSEIGNLINLKKLILEYNDLKNLPIEIGNLTNLKELNLHFNQLTILPPEIGNLMSLEILILHDNKITSLPKEILKIKEYLEIDETSYDINNLDYDCEILIFMDLRTDLINLPIGLKKIYLDEDWIYGITKPNIELPFGCEILLFKKNNTFNNISLL